MSEPLQKSDGRGEMTWFGIMTVILLGFAGGCSTVPATFHPNPAIPPRAFSHHLWDEVLNAHVADGQVDYQGVAKDKRFAEYLATLNQIDPNELPTRADRLAFWINAYNAFAVKGIIDGYSPRSLWRRYRFFIARDYRVGGETINLYDLERSLLVPGFKEPRIHFAIVCASVSCPKLRSSAYLGEELDRQLDEAARAFINDPSKNRFDRENHVAQLSMIFNWFTDDFVAHSGSVMQYVMHYVNDSTLIHELGQSPYTIEFLDYDWSLNGTPPRSVDDDRSAG